MEPRRGTVAPELDRWARRSEREARRTVVVRLRAGTDPGQAAARLAELGTTVADRGPGSVTGEVTPGVLRRIGQEHWVLAVEPPRRLRQLGAG